MKSLILVIGMLITSDAFAWCETHDNGKLLKYPDNQCDKYTLTNPDHTLHTLGGFTFVTAGSLIMKSAGASKWESIFYPWVIGFVAITAKEVLFDEITSGSDILGTTIGLTSGALFSYTFTF